MKHILLPALVALTLFSSGCETAYFAAMDKVGVHKREILVDRIEDAQEAQTDGQEEFKSALEQFRSVVNYDGGNLESAYNKLNGEYESSLEAAEDIREHVNKVDSVAQALFNEWEDEIELYTSNSLKRSSKNKLRATKSEYLKLISAMRKAEQSLDPVLNTLRDQVLFLKHNLNASAISSLRGELKSVDADVARLLQNMQRSIDESDKFIKQLRNPK